ncbi:MAG: glycosyltransferase [Flavobacteriaceae bacterium]|nr:glycosyltransferase [Flavobacteriaceae bacterium]
MKIKNLIYVPFHDWRKILDEGNRTRDAHFIEKFRSNNDIERLIILNRPITRLELLLKKKKINKKLKGEVILKSNQSILYKIDKKTYIIDSFLDQNIKHLQEGRKWYFKAFSNESFKHFYNQCIAFLKIENYFIISASVFSANFFSNDKEHQSVIFDAWDNFYLIPGLNSIKNELFNAYQTFSVNANIWVTNSQENKSFFKNTFGVNKINIIKNGVDFDKFNKNLPIPKDLKNIKKNNLPIVGFGGKITHLFDFNLFNYVAKQNENYNFIIVGQILDEKIFSKIDLTKNVFYLGDKNYKIYPNYLSNFDIGIIPYNIGKNQHGGDSIKVYEYLAAGLPVIGTRGNGLQDMGEYIYLTDSKEGFSKKIKSAKVLRKLSEKYHSWKNKEKELLSLLKY